MKARWAVLGGRLRQARQEIKLTQQAVAAHCKVTRQTVSGWERGDAPVDVSHLSELAVLYGKSTDYLIFGLRTVPVCAAGECGKCPNVNCVVRLALGVAGCRAN